MQEITEQADKKTPRAPRTPRPPRTPRENLEPREPREPRTPREPRKPREPRTPRTPRSPRKARQHRTQPEPGVEQTKTSFFSRFLPIKFGITAAKRADDATVHWLREMKVLPFLKLLVPQGITRHDYFFFIPLGLVIAFLMRLAEWVNPDLDSPVFNTLLTDHMPMLTINILFYLLLALTLFQLCFSPPNPRLTRFSGIMLERLHQLTSPILFILFGMALGLLALSFPPFHQDKKYFHYAMLWFGLMVTPYALIILSNATGLLPLWFSSADVRNAMNNWRARTLIAIVALGVFIGGLFNSSTQPPSVTLKFSDKEFADIKRQAAAANEKPEEYLKKLALPVSQQP